MVLPLAAQKWGHQDVAVHPFS